MVTTAMIRSLSFILSFGFPIVRCFIPHPSNEGPADTLFPRTTSAARLSLPSSRKRQLRRA